MNNKKIKTALVAAMLTSTMAYNIPAINATTLTQKSVDNPVLVPTPKKVTYEENTLSITNSVNIKGKDVADTDAVRELTEFLESNSITVNDDYQEGSTTIIIGEEDDEVDGLDATRDNLGLVDEATLDDEGYVLAVDSDNNGTVLIEGKDGDGTFYGVQTLTQLAVNDAVSYTHLKEVPVESDDNYEIYPIPQKVTDYDTTVELTNEINVIKEDVIDEVTKNRIDEVLTEHQLTPVYSTEPASDKINLYVGIKDVYKRQ